MCYLFFQYSQMQEVLRMHVTKKLIVRQIGLDTVGLIHQRVIRLVQMSKWLGSREELGIKNSLWVVYVCECYI